MMRHILPLLSGLLVWACSPLSAQINQMTFGKNRVQYHKDFADWSQYESENFVTYWYGQSRFIGQTAAQMAEYDFEEIQKTLEYRLNDKMEIIVYADISDLHQSNIGTEETVMTAGRGVKIVGEKIFVHFDGNHVNLRKQIREGIAGVFVNAMLFGSNLQEMVQNAISLNLPEWFKQGLLSYMGETWNAQLDDELRDRIVNKTYKNFNKFAQAEPRLAGHAFWYYVAQQFGQANVSNLLYLTRINRSLDDAMLYVMGSHYDGLMLACMEFYKKRYEKELIQAEKVEKGLKIKNKFKLPVPNAKLSPDGKRMAYVLNELGRWKVYVQEVKSGKRSEILRGGVRNPFQVTDYNYPLLAWNPDNQRLTIVYEQRDVVRYFEYNFSTKKARKDKFAVDLQRVYSIDFINAKDMVITAAQRGYSDVFLYNTVTQTHKNLTNDFWDDLEARFVTVDNRKGMVWASNRLGDRLENARLDSILPITHFDIFYKDLEDTARQLIRVTATPYVDERFPVAIDSTYFGFLSTESGISNRQVAYLQDILVRTDTLFYTTNSYQEAAVLYVFQDSMRPFPDTMRIDSVEIKPIYKKIAVVRNTTNFNHNIQQQHTAPRTGQVLDVVMVNGLPRLIVSPLRKDTALTPTFTRYWEWQQQSRQKKAVKKPDLGVLQPPKPIEAPAVKPVPVAPKPDTVKKVDIDNYVFQSEFDDTERPVTTVITKEAPKPVANPTPTPTEATPAVAADGTELGRKIAPFRGSRVTPYRLKFKTDYVTTRLDNSLLFGGLDSYAGTPQGFATPPMGILMKGNFKDLLEDYQLEGGVRLPTSFNGYEAFAFFDDRKRQIDRRYAIYHRSTRYTDNTNNIIDTRRSRTQTTLGQYELRYPFDMFQRIQVTGTLRSDRFTQLATDSNTLKVPTFREQRVGIKLEYVYDNALDLEINQKQGTRAKVWVDFVKKFEFDFVDQLRFNLNAGYLGIAAFDLRHYERVMKHATLAVRAAGSTSFGQERLLYVLGGTDNELFAGYNQDVATPAGNYAFQTLAANMRGFDRNSRNGTSFALINTELRVPIAKYFSSKPLSSSFWRNFQLVGFLDVGTAWHYSSPFDRNNPLNTTILPKNTSNAPVILKVNYFKDPIVAGYGLGARALIFGYLVRADYGWGIETRTIQKPQLHLAIGTDF